MSTQMPLTSDVYRKVYEGVNYRLRTFAGGRFASHCRPTSIGVMVTNRCNAKCVHCDIWKNRGQEDTPSLDEWKKTFTELREWLGPIHTYFSGGEALLRAWSTDLLAHGSKIGLFTEFLTHGYWEDQSRIEALANANPWRVTISLDGMGEFHTKVRGKAGFFEKTMRSVDTVKRIRKERGFGTHIRVKTVVMAHNLDGVADVAKYVRTQENMTVFFQAVEQNYNTPEDPRWWEKTDNWPTDPEKAISVVENLKQLKREGYPIANSMDQLDAMIPYFRNPDASRIQIQSHSAHEHKALCAALTTVQLMPNGDVITCYGMEPVGNIRQKPIREIWAERPQWWKNGNCCLYRRCSTAEKEALQLTTISV
jgi:MoaA/NifB/PqqE/SkfB family radical SAM enzyme